MQDAIPITASDGLRLHCTLASAHPQPLLLCLCLHGLNFSAASFLPLLTLLQAAQLPIAFACLDLRGHGASLPAQGAALAFTPDRLLQDLEEVLAALAQLRPGLCAGGPLLLGHSLGGALAIKCAARLAGRAGGAARGLVIIDFVEGSAVPAIPTALRVLQDMPRALASVEEAAAWVVGTGLLHSAAAARLVLPTALQAQPGQQQQQQQQLTWRADASGVLPALTAPLLAAFFQGASAALVGACRATPRLLVLARLDSLADRELTVAHMQGKFKVCVVPEASHCLHMDQPQKVAAGLLPFLAGIVASHQQPAHSGASGASP